MNLKLDIRSHSRKAFNEFMDNKGVLVSIGAANYFDILLSVTCCHNLRCNCA